MTEFVSSSPWNDIHITWTLHFPASDANINARTVSSSDQPSATYYHPLTRPTLKVPSSTATASPSNPRHWRPKVFVGIIGATIGVLMLIAVWKLLQLRRRRQRPGDYNAVPLGPYEAPKRWSQTSFTSAAPGTLSSRPDDIAPVPRVQEDSCPSDRTTKIVTSVQGMKSATTTSGNDVVNASSQTASIGASNDRSSRAFRLREDALPPQDAKPSIANRSQVDTYFDVHNQTASVSETIEPDFDSIEPCAKRSKDPETSWDGVVESMTKARLAEGRPVSDQRWAARVHERQRAQSSSKVAVHDHPKARSSGEKDE